MAELAESNKKESRIKAIHVFGEINNDQTVNALQYTQWTLEKSEETYQQLDALKIKLLLDGLCSTFWQLAPNLQQKFQLPLTES